MNIGKEVRILEVEPLEWPNQLPASQPTEPVTEPEKVGVERED